MRIFMARIAREPPDDVALLALVRAVVARDKQKISELLMTTPSLATQASVEAPNRCTTRPTEGRRFARGILAPRPRSSRV
jgi:hypothetical protein